MKKKSTKIKILRTDNGGELISKEFDNYLTQHGVVHQKTVPYTPEQNSVAERINRTLVETVRSMISDSKLDKSCWGEAVSTATHLRNRSPTVVLDNKTPYEALFGTNPSLHHFRTFGCMCYAHISKEQRCKLDPKSTKCVFMGYGSDVKAYRLFDLSNKWPIFSRDVIFDETKRISSDNVTDAVADNLIELENSADEHLEGEITKDVLEETNNNSARKSTRQRKDPDRYGEWTTLCVNSQDEPSSVNEALNSADSHLWKEAMTKEINSLKENSVWELVKAPAGRKIVGSKWVFKKKVGSDGFVANYKARLVAQGYSQISGVDYDETFSPVIRFETVRTILALSEEHDLQIHQLDVSSAFLNGNLDETIYVKQPEGFVV